MTVKLVIPAAFSPRESGEGIQVAFEKVKMDPRLRGDDEFVGLHATAHMYCSTAQRTNKFVIPAAFSPRESGEGIQVAFEKVKMDPR